MSIIIPVEYAVSLSQVSVESIQPLFGPMAGGTLVTITGQYVTTTSVTTVHIGTHVLDLHHSRFLLSYEHFVFYVNPVLLLLLCSYYVN